MTSLQRAADRQVLARRSRSRRGTPVWYWGVWKRGTRESLLLFETPTAYLPTGSEVKTKALSGEHPVARGLLRKAGDYRPSARAHGSSSASGVPAADPAGADAPPSAGVHHS